MSERDPDDAKVEQEAEAAAHEAAGVGGRAPGDDNDPARRAIVEAGAGEAEGFEQAEQELRENAEHGELGPRDPNRDAFTPEVESDIADIEYAEADDARTADRPDDA